MAASAILGCHFYASTARRPLKSFSSPKLAELASSISSLAKGASSSVEKATGRLLESFVDLAFKFEDQPWLPSQSNFRPVEEDEEEAIVTSIEGEIPDDFTEGVYIRNEHCKSVGTPNSGPSYATMLEDLQSSISPADLGCSAPHPLLRIPTGFNIRHSFPKPMKKNSYLSWKCQFLDVLAAYDLSVTIEPCVGIVLQ